MPPKEAPAREGAYAVIRIAVREAANGRLAVSVDDGEWHTSDVLPTDLDEAVAAESNATRKYGERLFDVFAGHPDFARRYAALVQGDDGGRIELTFALDGRSSSSE